MANGSLADFDFCFDYHNQATDTLPGLYLDRFVYLPLVVMEIAHGEHYRSF